MYRNFLREKFIVHLLCAAFLFLQTSCCTKKDCLGATDLWEIEFYNFSGQDIDTLLLTAYTKNTNFTSLVDSFLSEQLDSTENYFIAFLPKPIDTNLDYKIELVSTGEVFTLTGFEVRRDICNTCFLKEDYYDALHGYSINGVNQSEPVVRIFN